MIKKIIAVLLLSLVFYSCTGSGGQEQLQEIRESKRAVPEPQEFEEMVDMSITERQTEVQNT